MDEDPDGAGDDPDPVKDVEDTGNPPVEVVHRCVEGRFYDPRRIEKTDKEVWDKQEAMDSAHKPTVGFLRFDAQQQCRANADGYA